MKKTIKILIAIALLYLIISFIKNYVEANHNEEDIKKVTIGMKFKEVQKIMTQDTVFSGKQIYKQTIPVIAHFYDSSFGSSDFIQIWYTQKDSTVISVNCGD